MIIDVHAHIFNADCVPFRGFLDRVNPLAAWGVSELLEWSTYESEVDESKRGPARKWISNRLKAHGGQGIRVRRLDEAIADAGGPNLLEVMRLASGEIGAIAQTLVDEGSKEGVDLTVNLPMDLEYAYRKKEKLDIPYELQLEATLRACRRQKGKLVSFVFFDPRRPNALDLVRQYCENYPEYFKGVKVYPSLGYLPLGTAQMPQSSSILDDRLKELYAYCEANNLPITTHCSRGGVMCDKAASFQGKPLSGNDLSWFYRSFSAPMRWLPVLQAYPNLKLNLAHFGGGSFWRPPVSGGYPYDGLWKYEQLIARTDWREDIVTLMDVFPGVYTDLSYHPYSLHPVSDELDFYRKEIQEFLDTPKVEDRVMFGTDMHLVRMESNHRTFIRAYRALLGKPQGRAEKIFGSNAKTFLNLP